MHFPTQDFFDLSTYEHSALFLAQSEVWEALKQIESYLKSIPLGRIEGDVSSRAYLINPELIFVGAGSIVEPGAYIQGPCWIGKNCTIRHGAYIRGNVITGEGCVIGHDSEVKASIFLNKAHAAHFAYVGDSILGHEVNLGAGTKCANLKLNHQPISIRKNNQRIDTGLRKLGAIIGDGCQLGCNSVTNPGTLMGPRGSSYPCLNFGGFIPAGSTIKPSAGVIISSNGTRCGA